MRRLLIIGLLIIEVNMYAVLPDVVYRVDFGFATTSTNWNPSELNGVAETLSNINDSLGNATTVDIYNEDAWDGRGADGETTGIYPANVIYDYFYTASGSTNDLEFQGLNDSYTYTIELFASRSGVTGPRFTRITVGSDWDTVNVVDNQSRTAIIENISPTSGVIRFTIDTYNATTYYMGSIVLREYQGEQPFSPSSGSAIRKINGNTILNKFHVTGQYYNSWIGQSQSDFIIYQSWDFDDQVLGTFTDTEFRTYFGEPNVDSLNSHGECLSIVLDTIGGDTSRVLEAEQVTGLVDQGIQARIRLEQEYSEVYFSFRLKFVNGYDFTNSFKLPGVGGYPINNESGVCPSATEGVGYILLGKSDGALTGYHYDQTKGFCPWTSDQYPVDYVVDEELMVDQTWYIITQRYVFNTFTGGTPNTDGIREIWVNGALSIQEDDLVFTQTESDTNLIDQFRLSHYHSANPPSVLSYGHFDDFIFYMNTNDSVIGQQLHHPAGILPTPLD